MFELTILVPSALVGLSALWAIILYNQLVRSGMETEEAWSTVEVQIRRRANLVPSLIANVSAYVSHEHDTLEAVIRARKQVEHALGVSDVGSANSALDQALGRLFVVVESYPELKASTNCLELHKEFINTEEKLAYARQFYNRCVLKYNELTKTFPSSIIANAFNFRERSFFKPGDANEIQTFAFPTQAVSIKNEERKG